MKVRYETDIRKSEEELKEMLPAEKKWLGKERIHAVYLLKKGDCKNTKGLTGIIPRSGNTIIGRIKKYETGGIGLLLKIKSSPGRKPVLSDDIMIGLKKNLKI